jgi:hypothetical protein
VRRTWIIKSVCFLVLLVGLDRLVYGGLRYAFLKTESGERGGIVNRLRRARADVVVLGSSRAWRHFDTPYMQKMLGVSVFNGGCDGQQLPYACGVADLLVHDGPPKLLVLSLDPSSLDGRAEANERVTVLAPFMDESPVISELICRQSRFQPIKYLSRSVRYNGKPLAIVRNLKWPDHDENGFRPLDKRFDPQAASQDFNVVKRGRTEQSEVDPYLVNLLRSTIRSARAAGAEVVLTCGPYWRPDGHVPPQHKEGYAAVRSVAAGEKVECIMLTLDDCPDFADPALWADASHLNRAGARAFSERFLAEMGRRGLLASIARTTLAGP